MWILPKQSEHRLDDSIVLMTVISQHFIKDHSLYVIFFFLCQMSLNILLQLSHIFHFSNTASHSLKFLKHRCPIRLLTCGSHSPPFRPELERPSPLPWRSKDRYREPIPKTERHIDRERGGFSLLREAKGDSDKDRAHKIQVERWRKMRLGPRGVGFYFMFI